MTTPNIVPVGFNANSTDYLQAKCSRDGSAFVNRASVTVPSGTAVGQIVGLIPFRVGTTLVTGATDIASAALGAAVTGSIGVIYDDNVGNTNVPTLFVNASAVFTAGGPVPITETTTNLPYVTTGDGWIALTISGATTGTTGVVAMQALLDYFNGGIQA